MPKVLHLIHSLARGGIEKWLLSMVRVTPRVECAMDFCCKGGDVGPLAPLAEERGARVFLCPLRPGHLSFLRGLKRILREGRYDLLHCHLDVYSGPAVWVARRLGVPVIVSFHNTRFDPQTPLTKLPILRQLRWAYGVVSMNYALRRADQVTGCSAGVLRALDPGATILSPGRSRVLYYGVECLPPCPPEERAAFRSAFGWKADTPVLLHVGRFLEQKNHLGLLSIFQRVLAELPETRLLLVGDGMLRATVEKRVAAAGLADRVLLLGQRDDIPSLMSRCDVFLFPSLYEGFGLAALEANAAYLPVVGSRIPGLTEAVRDGETAVLHDVEDVEGMARSAVKMLTDREYSRRLARAGRAHVEASFSVEASARHLQETYRGLTNAGEQPRPLAVDRG